MAANSETSKTTPAKQDKASGGDKGTSETSGDQNEQVKIKPAAFITGTFDVGPPSGYFEVPVKAILGGENTLITVDYTRGKDREPKSQNANTLNLGEFLDWIGQEVGESSSIGKSSLPEGIAKFSIQMDRIHWCLDGPASEKGLYAFQVMFGETKDSKFQNEWSPATGIAIKNVQVRVTNMSQPGWYENGDGDKKSETDNSGENSKESEPDL